MLFYYPESKLTESKTKNSCAKRTILKIKMQTVAKCKTKYQEKIVYEKIQETERGGERKLRK